VTAIDQSSETGASGETGETPLLQVRHVKKYFPIRRGVLQREVARVHAVDDVSFVVREGETLGLVGESGCGKSTLGRTIVRLLEPTDGQIIFQGTPIEGFGTRRMRPLRREMQMVFQDPYASLNPRKRVGTIVSDPMRIHNLGNRAEQKRRVGEILETVGLSPEHYNRFPHEFSGGQRQRISIARALSSEPQFLACDEPTSALDVSVQAQILNLMKELQERLGLTYLFISHNLAVVSQVATRVGVMYMGRLVEMTDASTLFSHPRHPYTRMLLDAIPDLEMSGRPRTPVAGEVANPLDPPPGCAFHPRCPYANARCRSEVPLLRAHDGRTLAACHAVEEGRLPF